MLQAGAVPCDENSLSSSQIFFMTTNEELRIVSYWDDRCLGCEDCSEEEALFVRICAEGDNAHHTQFMFNEEAKQLVHLSSNTCVAVGDRITTKDSQPDNAHALVLVECTEGDPQSSWAFYEVDD
eukprot:m.93025 g.93025  ORF g.93025 m.93025 type:complete len:125 (-) comp8672_c0_seq3:438-812(-)